MDKIVFSRLKILTILFVLNTSILTTYTHAFALDTIFVEAIKHFTGYNTEKKVYIELCLFAGDGLSFSDPPNKFFTGTKADVVKFKNLLGKVNRWIIENKKNLVNVYKLAGTSGLLSGSIDVWFSGYSSGGGRVNLNMEDSGHKANYYLDSSEIEKIIAYLSDENIKIAESEARNRKKNANLFK